MTPGDTWYRVRPSCAKVAHTGYVKFGFGEIKRLRWEQLALEDVRVVGGLSDLIDGTAQVYVRNRPELVRP